MVYSSCCSESQREAALLLGQFAAADSDCKVYLLGVFLSEQKTVCIPPHFTAGREVVWTAEKKKEMNNYKKGNCGKGSE